MRTSERHKTYFNLLYTEKLISYEHLFKIMHIFINHGCGVLMTACARGVCACGRAPGALGGGEGVGGTCERREREGGERAPIGLSLSRTLWLCRGAAVQRRHALPRVHVLQLRVHACHLQGGGHDQPVSTESLRYTSHKKSAASFKLFFIFYFFPSK